jgi:hypothetical protein
MPISSSKHTLLPFRPRFLSEKIFRGDCRKRPSVRKFDATMMQTSRSLLAKMEWGTLWTHVS